MGGCGGAEQAAADASAPRSSPTTRSRCASCRRPLQQMLLELSVGQATPPFGSLEDGVSVLVLCGRDDPQQASGPSFDQIDAQLQRGAGRTGARSATCATFAATR